MAAWDYTNNWGNDIAADNTQEPAVPEDAIEQDATSEKEAESETPNAFPGESDKTTSSEPTEETTVAPSTASTKRKAVKKKKDTIANVDAKDVRKLYDVVEYLKSDEHAVAVAKLMTNSNKSDVFELAAELTNGRNAVRIRKFVDMAQKLGGATSATVMALVIIEFTSHRDGVKDVFGLLNAVAPDREFGRVNKPEPEKYFDYASQIASKWDDGVDMGIVPLLRI